MKGVVERLRKPLQQALIIKFLGKLIGYFVIMDRFKEVWKPSSGLDIVDIEHGYYMIKFEVCEDHEMVFGHYLKILNGLGTFLHR